MEVELQQLALCGGRYIVVAAVPGGGGYILSIIYINIVATCTVWSWSVLAVFYL